MIDRKILFRAAIVVGALGLLPDSASAQGLWYGGWGWGGPVAIAPAPVVFGYGPPIVPTVTTVGYGVPVLAPAPVLPVYGPVVPGPVVVAPRAHAIRVANRVARRNWRWGYPWGY